ncbi:hypothetical protein INR49_019584, partial [Caranx melampygus]
ALQGRKGSLALQVLKVNLVLLVLLGVQELKESRGQWVEEPTLERKASRDCSEKQDLKVSQENQDLLESLENLQGLSGLDGLLGVEGNEGDPGKPGTPGISGNIGAAGFKGKTGPKGTRGPPGPIGPKGIPGLRGEKGETGSLGTKGNPGLQGLKGRKGRKGQQGKHGQMRSRLVKRILSEGQDSEESFSWPLGTKDDPATTCHELGLMHPHLNNGYFYMDPNQGCPCDAVKVFCNFTAGGTTCIDPLKSQFEYPGLDVVQLRFLRFQSHTSFQHLTVSCTGNHSSAAATTDSTNRSIRLLGDSGTEIGSHLMTVSQKGCEGELVVRVRGSTEQHRGDMELLPIRDLGVEVRELSSLSPETAVVLGPLCFL